MHGPDPISFTYTTKEGGPYKLDLSNGRTHKSRETWGVWVHKDRAWKIFPGVDQWERVKNDYTTATARGLPTPSYELHQGTLSYSHNRTKEVATKEGFALITKYIAQPPARFFALKNGIKALKGLIAPITNDDILSKIEQAFSAAMDMGLRDPQGFFNQYDSNQPIVFIDIHTSNFATKKLEDLRDYVRDRRATFQRQQRGY